MELYKKHRPTMYKDIIGQQEAVKMLQSKKEIQHFLLFTGPSGCTKTTLARIVAKKLGCGQHDLHEVNCADFRGIDTIRDIRTQMDLAPISGKCSVWIIDEAHKLTNDAQNAFLKMLEDTPNHVYFMLATTEPNKLLKTVITRATQIVTRLLTPKEVSTLVKRIAAKENFKLTEEVEEKIVNVCEGSARKALVLLESILDVKDEEDQLSIIQKGDYQAVASNIFKELISPYGKWANLAPTLKTIEEEPEGIRMYVLAAARNVLLANGKGASRAFTIIQSFRDNFYDGKHAALAAACYEVLTTRK